LRSQISAFDLVVFLLMAVAFLIITFYKAFECSLHHEVFTWFFPYKFNTSFVLSEPITTISPDHLQWVLRPKLFFSSSSSSSLIYLQVSMQLVLHVKSPYYFVMIKVTCFPFFPSCSQIFRHPPGGPYSAKSTK